MIKIQPTLVENFTNKEVYVFLSYQRLPGPLAHDHDSMFHIRNLQGTNFLSVPEDHLVNKTGLFYVGIGIVDTNGKDCVRTSFLTREFLPYIHPAGIRFEVSARALTKGCYHYDNSTDHFENTANVVSIG
ncbi:unnamed protein product [Strongylus vulgaris]|uniref:Uncharacterized protein n=1 Tax=Strongylus vulgaris TaxID=40348 RepID=A0A3P7JIP3_STRVU|nr:unnamed protein product [Strongylus vulgaris]